MTGSCQREFALQVSRGATAVPFDALKLQKLPNNRDKKQAKPAGSSCSPSAEGSRIRRFPPARSQCRPGVQRRRWQSEPSLGFGYTGQVLMWSEERTVTTSRKRKEKQRGKPCSQSSKLKSIQRRDDSLLFVGRISRGFQTLV